MSKLLNKRIDGAIRFATFAHKRQVRKTEPEYPYICHPLGVGMILKNAGFSESVVIAGILHDTIEDVGVTPKEIENRFGRCVRKLVESVTEDKSLPYEQRKRLYLEGILNGSDETKAISTADSLQNINSIMVTLKERGEQTWKEFTKGKEGAVKNYLKKTKLVHDVWPHALAKEALDMAEKLKRLAKI
ncbi:MAG: HD domain-containing protein [Candidatus Paceibacterota bacterium]